MTEQGTSTDETKVIVARSSLDILDDLMRLQDEVALGRAALRVQDENVAKAEEILAKRIEAQDLANAKALRGEVKAALSTNEDNLRKVAAEYFRATGVKKVTPYVGARSITVVSFEQPQEAVKWAIEHDLPGLLLPDEKQMKQLVLGGMQIDGVVSFPDAEGLISSKLGDVEENSANERPATARK